MTIFPKLVKSGIPDRVIAFIHDANTDKQKAELFGRVRSGVIIWFEKWIKTL